MVILTEANLQWKEIGTRLDTTAAAGYLCTETDPSDNCAVIVRG